MVDFYGFHVGKYTIFPWDPMGFDSYLNRIHETCQFVTSKLASRCRCFAGWLVLVSIEMLPSYILDYFCIYI